MLRMAGQDDHSEMVDRWPNIKRFLRVERSGWIEADSYRWWRIENTLPPVEQAAGNEEWADFFEWRLEQWSANGLTCRLVAKWTDSMAYCCRRVAAYARGEDPGEAIPQHQRRPDLALGYGTTGSASSKIAPASSAL
jgi:hypothetical protein